MKQAENIILTGFMGTGKSHVGRELARLYGYALADTDRLIEERQGRRITEIFAQEGEEAFRCMETELVRDTLPKLQNTVVSVGGGLPLREENRTLLKKAGMVILLKTSLEETLRRLQGDRSRPLLAGPDGAEKAKRLLEERLPVYESGADCIIGTDGKEPQEIAQEIQRSYVEWRRRI